MRSLGSVFIAVGAVLMVLALLLGIGADVVSFALELVGLNDTLIYYNPIVIAGLGGAAILLGIVVLCLPHKRTTAERL